MGLQCSWHYDICSISICSMAICSSSNWSIKSFDLSSHLIYQVICSIHHLLYTPFALYVICSIFHMLNTSFALYNLIIHYKINFFGIWYAGFFFGNFAKLQFYTVLQSSSWQRECSIIRGVKNLISHKKKIYLFYSNQTGWLSVLEMSWILQKGELFCYG